MDIWINEMTGLVVSTAISVLLPYLVYALERYLKIRLDAAARATRRCQFHLARNAIHHAPSLVIRKRIGTELRAVRNAASSAKAEAALAELVATYRDTAPKLAAWLEEIVPQDLAVFALPAHHRRRMRTSNAMGRAIQQELKRRTAKVRVFPGKDARERVVSAILVEIDERWASDTLGHQCLH